MPNHIYRIITKSGAGFGFQGLVIISTSSFNGINKPYPSTLFSMIRMLVLYVPLAWIGARLFDINGVFWAGLIANLITGYFSCKYLQKRSEELRSAPLSDPDRRGDVF